MARLGAEFAKVDRELRWAARVLPGGYALHRGLTVPRALMNLAVRMGRLEGVQTAAVDRDVAVRVHRASGSTDPGPVLLWIHGGGTVMGGAAQEDGFCRRLTNFTDVSVVAVDHRLAPEYPYPVPVLDCYAALTWLAAQPWVDRERIAIGGASAGGGIAAMLAVLARDRGEVSPAMQLLVYPMLDDRSGSHGYQPPRVMWSARDNQIAWRWYLGSADLEIAVPARQTDFVGLPQAWIGVGSLDLFHDEAVDHSRRLKSAGIATHLHIAEGAFHAFDMIAPKASVSQRFFASQCRALRTVLVDGGAIR
jgi:acetyl esterase/lipase